jgi:CubicO group peptidase (beta-lactamase class C family)
MRSFPALAAAAALAVVVAAAPAATVAPQVDPKFEQLASLVTQKMAEYGVPGVAFGIVKNGRATVRGFGVTNLDNPSR